MKHIIKPEGGTKGYAETSYLSYNITPLHNPKELPHQFYRGESLGTPMQDFDTCDELFYDCYFV
jgi:hypothetical protein